VALSATYMLHSTHHSSRRRLYPALREPWFRPTPEYSLLWLIELAPPFRGFPEGNPPLCWRNFFLRQRTLEPSNWCERFPRKDAHSLLALLWPRAFYRADRAWTRIGDFSAHLPFYSLPFLSRFPGRIHRFFFSLSPMGAFTYHLSNFSF